MTTPVSTEALAERRRLGLDVFDEVWDGVLHMVPNPPDEHQRAGGRLFAFLLGIADGVGLEVRYEFGVYRPGSPGHHDYRVPDLVVFDQSVRRPRGVEGAAHLVVEIRSPGDESFAKLGFYGEVGVREVVIIDRDTKAIRRWINDGVGHLSETPPDRAGRQGLACLPVDLRTDGGVLVATTRAGDVTSTVETRI